MRVLTLVAVLVAFGAAQADAATRWSGETHGSVHRSNRLAAGGSSWDGSFWFRAARDGTIKGEVVVAYKPEIDLGGANQALGFIRDITSVGVGMLPYGFGTAVNTIGIPATVGFSVDFQQGTAIRRGKLTGRLANGRIELRWPQPVNGVPYTLAAITKTGQETISSGTAGLYDPFKGTARNRNGFAVHATQTRSSGDGVTERIGSYWAAHRVG